ncbi:MAG: MFS transporter [Planctomycetota bacterium]|nr:MAG: MFS transporter [Planctomycetota bacterium]
MDVSSELVHGLLPVFLAAVLHSSVAAIGVVEGVAEATAALTKVFSGAVSDTCRRRKPVVLLGYGLSALTKPFFPLAAGIEWVFGARFVDRIGKGIRGAPRDALVADLVPPRLRGAAYGLRQALDSVGACLGPLLAVEFMALFANDVRAVLWVAVVPAFLAVLLLIVAVLEPERAAAGSPPGLRLTLRGAGRLPRGYWLVVALGALLTLARFSEAFLILRGYDVGLAMAYVPGILVAMNLVYAGAAYPAGAAADRIPARTLLLLGLGVLVGADVVLALAARPGTVFLGAAFWGLHLALTQGLLAKLVADSAPVELRGTAFGWFNMVTGCALLLASVLAGWLWSRCGAGATFLVGASFAALAAVGLSLFRPTAWAAARGGGG